MADRECDLRKPGIQPAILVKYAASTSGESLVLVSNHDPEYVEKGPETVDKRRQALLLESAAKTSVRQAI